MPVVSTWPSSLNDTGPRWNICLQQTMCDLLDGLMFMHRCLITECKCNPNFSSICVGLEEDAVCRHRQ